MVSCDLWFLAWLIVVGAFVACLWCGFWCFFFWFCVIVLFDLVLPRLFVGLLCGLVLFCV